VKPALAALALILVVAAPAFAEAPKPKASHFRFKVPDGWTDKSVPETRGLFTLAFDEPNQLLFQASVSPGGDPATPAFLDKYAGDAQKSVARRLKGAELKVIKKELCTIGGVPAARFVFEMPPPPDAEDPQEVRQLQFYVPAGDQHAVLTFSAPRKSFAKFEPLFDKTARATQVTP